jgi:hypothetical protein
MGLLDEAIREHLELKRRHGADPGELARLEQEALGPARREAAPAVGGPDDAVSADDEALGDEPPLDEPDAYDPTDEDERVEALAEDEEPIYDDELLGEEDEPPPAPPARPGAAEDKPSPDSSVDQPTVQFDVPGGDAPRGAGGERAHDELEDTPEFLQETPEHDRLWFEQKPPKDFDF